MRGSVVLALGMVAACGRIDFDPLAGGAPGGGDGGTDGGASGAPARSVSVGAVHACAVDGAGALWCWGGNVAGERGDGGSSADSLPVRIGSDTWLTVAANSIATMQASTCAIRSDGTLWCWGLGEDGELGIGTATSEPVPTQVGAATWREVSVGLECNACGIQSDGSLWCWGGDDSSGCGGEVGDGASPNALSPVPILSGSWSSVSVGDDSICAVRDDGTLWCWGAALGMLGTFTNVPVQIGSATDWASATVGAGTACGLHADQTLSCWGSNSYAAVGDGTMMDVAMPEPIGAATWLRVSVSGNAACAISTDGSLWCWGNPTTGGLGTTGTALLLTPTLVDAEPWTEIFVGIDYTTCGIRRGVVVCTGEAAGDLLGRIFVGSMDWATSFAPATLGP